LFVMLIVLESSTSEGTNATTLVLTIVVVESEVTHERHSDRIMQCR
jgi:hypothetical protein